MGEAGGGEEKGSSLPFSLPSFPFCPETPDTKANLAIVRFPQRRLQSSIRCFNGNA